MTSEEALDLPAVICVYLRPEQTILDLNFEHDDDDDDADDVTFIHYKKMSYYRCV